MSICEVLQARKSELCFWIYHDRLSNGVRANYFRNSFTAHFFHSFWYDVKEKIEQDMSSSQHLSFIGHIIASSGN